jgi:hypothetical protein
MKADKLRKFFEEQDFNVHLTKQDNVQSAEVETWTNGGVNMIMWLNPFSTEEFESYVNDFDIDETIELHRKGQDYKNAFTMRQSLQDFEEYHTRLKTTLSELKSFKK